MKCKLAHEDMLSKMCKCAGKYSLNINEFSNPLALNYGEIIKNMKELAISNDFNILLVNIFPISNIY